MTTTVTPSSSLTTVPFAYFGKLPSRGDFVRSVNGRKIATVPDLVAATTARAQAWQVTIERNGQKVTASFPA